jgi:hypothetical protein
MSHFRKKLTIEIVVSQNINAIFTQEILEIIYMKFAIKCAMLGVYWCDNEQVCN